jgi:hypothetical protein
MSKQEPGDLMEPAPPTRLGLVVLSSAESDSIAESKFGFSRFSITRPHDSVSGIGRSRLCLIYSHQSDSTEGAHLSVVRSNHAVSTVSSRLVLEHGVRLDRASASNIAERIPSRFKTHFATRAAAAGTATLFPERLGQHVWKALAEHNSKHLQRLLRLARGSHGKSTGERLSGAALRDAVSVFGLHDVNAVDQVWCKRDQTSVLADLPGPVRLLEDRVIEHDARDMPGWSLVKATMTGMAIFEKDMSRLAVFTANRGPVEAATGADLIYINEVMGNAVLVQYKMFEEERQALTKRWVFRPDEQYNKEVARMHEIQLGAGDKQDYRLNSSPFYFKFVRRIEDNLQAAGAIITLNHLEAVLSLPEAVGPKGGLRLDFNGLLSRYLRKREFVGLVQSGYIGAHRDDTARIQKIVELSLTAQNRASIVAHENLIDDP